MAGQAPYIGGGYILYSELFDRKPEWSEMEAFLRPLNALNTVLLFSRTNTYLRHALQHGTREAIGWMQGFLVRNFIDDDALNRMKLKFPLARMEDRPIFHPIQVLNMIRISLVACQGDETNRPDDREELRYKLGTACLMMNDLLLTKEEELSILEGSTEERSRHLMCQMLAPFELLNPQEARNVLFRSHVCYRILLRDTNVRDEIKNQCHGLDFEQRFAEIAGVSLSNWLSLLFGSYSYYMGRSRDDLIGRPEFFIINRRSFIGESKVSQEEMDRFLATASFSLENLQKVIGEERPVDPRFDLIPFRSRPLFQTVDGNFACVDVALLLEKMHSGAHWVLHDSMGGSERDDLFRAWGILFEHYVSWLFRGAARLPAAFFPFPRWKVGNGPFDGVFTSDGLFVPMEYKGGFLSQQGKYSGSIEALEAELERKIVPGCRQLTSKIGSLFHREPAHRRRLEGIPTEQLSRVLPILIVQDHGLRSPGVAWWLNRRFANLMTSHPVKSQVEVLPLNVVNVEDLERLVESAEAENFDFIYALHHKAARDPEMKHDLHNFLFGMTGYPTRGSKRAEVVLDGIKDEMFSFLFSPDIDKGS